MLMDLIKPLIFNNRKTGRLYFYKNPRLWLNSCIINDTSVKIRFVLETTSSQGYLIQVNYWDHLAG